ncbi:cupin domain-containing protein [Lysinibacillus xylanilyticus]|uniref:cupin domain-containing protein n=1 Tax=Lysinibacillus xylanilyticus TaxID=582475 RepID=UPI002B243246|nr:cupin domain-containing protein [Lysinibacillus xylanilyticus]MEB2279529.1 cupin domain-containing protein [Lysinibacillus xylanilyticus]
MTLKKIARKDLKNRIFHWPDIQEFREEEATKHIFYETPNTVGAVWCMHPGQNLPIHSHEKADDIWIVVEGTADFYPECGEMVQIKAGDVVVARAGEKHGMTNNSDKDFVMLGIAGPTPIGFIPHKHH